MNTCATCKWGRFENKAEAYKHIGKCERPAPVVAMPLSCHSFQWIQMPVERSWANCPTWEPK